MNTKIYIVILFFIAFFTAGIDYCNAQGNAQDCYSETRSEGLKLMEKGRNAHSKDEKTMCFNNAIKAFKTAKECDPKPPADNDLDKLIAQCRSELVPTPAPVPQPKKTIAVAEQDRTIIFSNTGATRSVPVTGDSNWTMTVNDSWCKARQSGGSIIIECPVYDNVNARTTKVTVKGANNNVEITVTQQAAKERLSVSTNKITFTAAADNVMDITIDSNTEWNVSNSPEWCKITRNGNKLTLKADSNTLNVVRPGNITVSTANNQATEKIEISQMGTDMQEKLEVSKNALSYPAKGGSETIEIYSNTSDWTIGDFPKWCNVKKAGSYSISIECFENSDPRPRTETIQIKTANQTIGIKITQRQGFPAPPTPTPIDNIIGGRNVSFGITGGANMASFKTSVSGEYNGSVVNYGYAGGYEEPDYSSEIGFSVGLIADIRLKGNFYLQTGLNYSNYKLKNAFSGNYVYEAEQTATTYTKGTAYDDFVEKYELNYIELPLLFSYKFKISKKANLHLNAGGFVGYGISGKVKIEGTTDWPSLTEYYYSNNTATGDTYYMNCNTIGELDLFGTSGSSKEEYTTGAMSEYEYKYEFKDSPFKNLNAGLSFGTAIEFHGILLGLSYDMGLMNIVNDSYWSSTRMNISDYEGGVMEGYEHKISNFRLKLGYIFRW